MNVKLRRGLQMGWRRCGGRGGRRNEKTVGAAGPPRPDT